MWEWLHLYGGKIMNQFRRMGASLDYRRERFTMDDAYVRAVMRFFVHLYRKGWIYRTNRIINWCPFHQTSLSDLELVDVELDDTLSTYPLPARRRLGLHRDRDRAARRRSRPTSPSRCIRTTSGTSDLVGKEAIVPFVERRVPIIADERVEPDFGTGALKITPGHDPEGLRDRPRPRPAGAGRDRPGRPHERQRAGARRA